MKQGYIHSSKIMKHWNVFLKVFGGKGLSVVLRFKVRHLEIRSGDWMLKILQRNGKKRKNTKAVEAEETKSPNSNTTGIPESKNSKT